MAKPGRDDMGLQPVFLHSSFRTGSTWLWSKFRRKDELYCYYEVFNEFLATLDFRELSRSASTWNSHHPAGPPYFSEFSPLLDDSAGIRGFDEQMAVSDFFLAPNGDADRVAREKEYLTSLVELALSNGRMPVLSCTRSIGRVSLIKEAIGGTHILIKRNLLNHWFSYSNQGANNNPYFLQSIVRTIGSRYAGRFMNKVHRLLSENDITGDDVKQHQDDLLIAFLALHIYLYASQSENFDLILDFEQGMSAESLRLLSKKIENLTTVRIDMSDYREVVSAPYQLISDIDRVVMIVRTLFAEGIPDIPDGKLRDFVDCELRKFQAGYADYQRVAGSAHDQLDRNAAATAELRALHKETIEQLSALHESAGNQISTLKQRFDDTTQDVIVAIQRAEKAELEAHQARAQCDTLAAQLADANMHVAGIARSLVPNTVSQERFKDCEQARDAAEQRLAAAHEHISALERDIQQAEGSNVAVQAELDVAISDLRAMTSRIEGLEVSLREEQTQARLLRDNAALASEQERDLRQALEQGNVQRLGFEERLTICDRAKAAAVEAVNATRAELDAQSAHVIAVTEQVEALEATLREERAQQIALHDRVSEMTASGQGLRRAIEQIQADRDDVERRLAESEAARKLGAASLENALERNAAQDRDLREGQQRIDAMTKELEFVASGKAGQQEAFERRWSAMLDRLS